MITIHEATATDFSTLGLGALDPSECTIEEKAGGLYELTLIHPITDDLRHELIRQFRIIKAPAPVRETPLLSLTSTSTTTREIYKVTTEGGRLNLRTGAGLQYRVLHAYEPGTEVVKQAVDGDWMQVVVVDGGASGWMNTEYLTFVRTETDTIQGDTPGQVVQPRQTREQLFRISEIEIDNKLRTVTARAQHITYDLKGALVVGQYEPEKVAADIVCAELLTKIDHDISEFNIFCAVTDPVSGDYGGKCLLECLFDPDFGVVAQTHARVIRDNYDLFILPDEARDRWVEIRYGKNLLSAALTTDCADIITRIRPVGKDATGEKLYIVSNNGWVDSERIDDYPNIYAKEIEYDVVAGEKQDDEAARQLLQEKAQADFDGGCDLPNIKLDADFVRLDLTDEYRELANAYALHLYDQVPVIDHKAGVVATARMMAYKFDCVLNRYSKTTLGEMTEAETTVFGYEIATGSISGAKIVPNSVNGDRLKNLSVGYGKIEVAAIGQLTADSVTAVKAVIHELAAGSITTDELYADLAAIAVAQITTANIKDAEIEWAEIDTLAAQIAEIATAEIGRAEITTAQIANADIDYAKIKDLAAGTAIITEGVGGELYINRLAVTEANMVQLTVGALMLKAADGSFVQLIADGSGGVTTQTVQVEGDNVAEATIPGGKMIENTITARELNVSAIFADTALIRAIKAANIDVADLFAADATITALDNYIIRTETISAIQGQLDVWASDKITLAVDGIRTGGTQMIRNSRTMKAGTTLETFSGSGTYYDLENGFTAGQITASGATSDLWKPIYTSAAELPGGWMGREITVSAYIQSPDWTQADGGMTCCLNLSQGTKTRMNFTNKALVNYNDGNPAFADGVKSDTPLENGKWIRVSVTYELTEEGIISGSGTLEENTHVYATFFLRKNGDVRVYAPKLEWGNQATDWSPHPEEFEAGSGIVLTEEQVSITTPEFSVNVTSEDGTENMLTIDKNGAYMKSMEAPNVAPRYNGPLVLYVNPDATSAQIAAGNYFRSMADAFSSLNNRQITQSVTVKLAAGMTEYGTVQLLGVSGSGWVYIEGNSSSRAKLVGRLNIYWNTASVRVQYLDIDSALNAVGIDAAASSFVQASYCTVTGLGTGATVDGSANDSSVGIRAQRNASVQVSNCELYDTYRALYVQTLGNMQSLNNKGNCTIGANRSLIFVSGTAPSASTTWVGSKVQGGQIFEGTITVDQGSKPTPETAPTTVTFSMTNADNYTMKNGSWTNYSDNDIRQGYTSALGMHRGCFWFDNTTIRSTLSGKTIKSATLSLYQMAAGRNQPVQVNLEGITMNYSGRTGVPYGNPEYGVIGTTAGINQTTTFTIPTAVIDDLVAGTINGLMLRNDESSVLTGDDNSYHYAKFAGGTTTANRPVLTVAYS